jgi:hypothetical protein
MSKKLDLKEVSLLDSSFSIYMPRNYKVTESGGEDFSVFYFSPVGSSSKIEYIGGVYFGNHPSISEMEADTCKVSEKNGSIVDTNVEWIIRACFGEFHVETVCESKSRENWNKYIHAFGRSESKEGLDTLMYIFSTLRNSR